MAAGTRHDNDKRVVRTKKAIKSALFKLMETKDISAITISELTALANVNRRTFYTHYRNLTDILNEIEGELISAMKELGEKFDTRDAEKSTYDLFVGLDRLITVDFDYYFQLVRVDMRGMLVSRLKNVIKTAEEEVIKQLTAERGDDAAAIAAFLAGGFFNVYIDWHYNPRDLSLERAATIASAMVGVCLKNASSLL